MNGSVKEPNMFHNCKTERITRKASDAAENLQLCRVVRFLRPRLSCTTTTHLVLFTERLPIYALCMTISGGRTEPHVIIVITCCSAVPSEKITRKASDAAKKNLNNVLFGCSARNYCRFSAASLALRVIFLVS